VVLKYRQCIVWFVIKNMCGRETGRQNYDSQDQASIAAHAVKYGKIIIVFVIVCTSHMQ